MGKSLQNRKKEGYYQGCGEIRGEKKFPKNFSWKKFYFNLSWKTRLFLISQLEKYWSECSDPVEVRGRRNRNKDWMCTSPLVSLNILSFSLFFSNLYYRVPTMSWVFPGGSDSKESTCTAEDPDLIPGSGRSPAEGNGNPLQYSCLENPIDRGAWQATVHRITKSPTRLK